MGTEMMMIRQTQILELMGTFRSETIVYEKVMEN